MIITEKKNITDKKIDDFVGEKLMNFIEKIEIRLRNQNPQKIFRLRR